ncbi:MAG: hypothetical protein QM479_05300 [Pseudomonadota bacterium]
MKKRQLKNLIPLSTSFILISSLVNFNLSASEFTAQRSLFPNNQGSISTQMSFDQSESGDIYIAYRMNGEGDLYFLNQVGFSLQAVPYESIESFNGIMLLPEFDTTAIPVGNYQMYQVLVTTGTDVYDTNNWIGGDTALHSLNFPVGQDSSMNIDVDGNGWSDDDLNRDGFADDDRDRDGYHDDDVNKDGFHDDDFDMDGYHDDDLNKDGFHDDDLDRDGYHDNEAGNNSSDDNMPETDTSSSNNNMNR